jgi:hypothetical protein
MDKTLTYEGWKAFSAKHGFTDKRLHKLIVELDGLAEDDYDARGECLGKIATLAAALRKDDAASGKVAVIRYLMEMGTAAQAERRALAKTQLAADKLSAKEAAEEEDDEEEEDEDEDADPEDAKVESYPKRLRAALDALKTAKEPFHFVFCVAKPMPALMVSKTRVGAGAKKVLTTVTGGSRRFLKPGTVVREGKALVFDVPNPPAKLALLMRNSIQHFTGKKYRIRVGDEEVEGDDEPEVAGPQVDAAPPAPKPALETAPQVWSVTQRVVKSRIEQLKGVILETFAGEGADLVRELEKNVKKLDAIFERLDDDLATILERTAAATDAKDRADGLKLAKTLLAEHVKFVKSEPMIAHIDSNPFGVKTDLQGTLTKSLKHVASALGG